MSRQQRLNDKTNTPSPAERVALQERPEKVIPAKPASPPLAIKKPTLVVPDIPQHNIPKKTPGAGKYAVGLSEDRGTIIISASGGEERDHISLDPDRVQKIYTAPDGKWSIAVIKVRGKQQYGAMPINLQSGSPMETLEIPSMPISVTFEKRDAVMSFNNSDTKRINLQN
jgi:hypothetical protein